MARKKGSSDHFRYVEYKGSNQFAENQKEEIEKVLADNSYDFFYLKLERSPFDTVSIDNLIQA